MYAIQGAMAIRRQRQLRENRRMSQVRMSTKSGRKGSNSPRGSDAASIEAPVAPDLLQPKGSNIPKAETSQTAFYLGVVFILLGFLMIFSSMISNSALDTDWSRLLGVGVTFLLVGLIMVMVNRIITAREEEELKRYVSHRLGRSRSGHTLVRDAESGEDFHFHLQRIKKQQPKPKSPRPQKSPRENPADPFPKFRQSSQVLTRSGSSRTSPIGPGPKSASQHSNLSTSNHFQNGKPHPHSDAIKVDHIPVVVVDEPTETACPKPVSNEQTLSDKSEQNSSKDVVQECSKDVPECSKNFSENGEVPFSSEVVSETESLLKRSKSSSMNKSKTKKKPNNNNNSNNAFS